MIDVRSKTIVKMIAGILAVAFLAQDIVWANPDTLQIPLMTGTLRTDALKALIEVKLQEIVRSIPLQELKERGYSLVVEERGKKFKISFETDAENRLVAYCDSIIGKTASHRFIINDDLSTSEDKPFSPDISRECTDDGDVIKYPHSDVAHGLMRTDGNGMNLYIDVTDLFEGTAPSFKGKNVLVMGCGGGATCFKLALEGAGKVTGIDIDKNSIAMAKTIAPYMRVPLLRNVLSRPQPSIGFEIITILETMEDNPEALRGYEYSGPDAPEFITADARNLSCFQDNSFDYVVIPFMIGVLNGLQDEDVYYAIKEALRVVKPGGILYIEPFSRNTTEEREKLISKIIRLPLEQAVAFEILADIVSYLETDSINGKGLEKVGGSAHSFVVKARPVDIVKKAPYEEDIIEHLYTENVAMVSTNISKETETDFKGAKNLSELLAMLPDRPLEVLDIGTGNGEFCDNLANMYPGRFRRIIGIDKMMGSSTENETGGAKISIRRNMPLEEFQNDKDNQNRFDIVFSNNTEIIRQHFSEILPKILKPGGIAILTFNWHMALTERYRAFETENSIHEFLDPIGGDIAGSMGLGSTAVANLDGYPDTLYTKIPGFIIIHRLPEGDNMAAQANAAAEPKPFVAAEDAERNEWKIVKRSLAGLAEDIRDGSKSRLPSSFREHFAGALRRAISGIQDIEKPSPGDVYGLKKDLAMALRILNSAIAYKLGINSAQLKGMFADDFVISSGLQSGIEAALGKNDFIPSYKDADGHAGQLGEIRHINDVFTSIHLRISWLSRVLESRENKSSSPESAEPASIRQDFDVWTDSITYDISQLPYYSSEIQEGISVISVMYAHLLLNSYDAVIKRVESGEEYDYLPKIKIRISLVDAGEGELVLRGSLEDSGTGVSEAALQQLMEEKITTKSEQASDGSNQKISAADFGGVGLGVLNAISKLTVAFPGRSSIVLTTESSDGAFIKMFDPSSGTSTISDIPESGNGCGTNIEINIKLTPGQNVEKGVIYESLWAPQSKPFAPDMAKEEPADSAASEDKTGPQADRGIYKYKKMLLILGGGIFLASFDINNYLYCGLAIRIPAMAIGLSLMLTSAILYYKAGQSERNKAKEDALRNKGGDKPFSPDIAKEDKQNILHPAYAAYNMAQKDIINPDNKPLRAVYGGAGYDVTNLLQSTNARTACFVSDYSILSWNEFMMLEKEGYVSSGYKNDLDETYSHDKYDFGYIGGDLIKHKERAFDEYEHGDTFAKSLSVRKQMIAQLAYELHSLGVTKVKVDMYKGCPRITFRWAYEGASEEEYSITFVTADITKPGKYPEALRSFLEEGVDVYFQRAGERIANDYSKKHDNFIISLSKYLRQGGFFVTDDIAVRSVAGIFSGQPRYVNRAGKFPLSLQVITSADLEKRKEEALAVRTKLPGRLNLGYGLIVTIRQADKVKTVVSGENDPAKNPRRSQSIERIAEEAYKKFEGICLEQIRLIREELRTGQYEKMTVHLKEITTAIDREFKDPRLKELRIVTEDMMQDFCAIQLFIDQKNDRKISTLMDNAEEVFKGFRQLAAAGKIMEAWKARVSSGVFDLSQVLGNDKPGRKPSPDMVKEEIMLAFRIATIDPYGPDFDGIIGQIETIRQHLGNNDPPEFIKRFIREDMPLSFVAFQEGAVAGYLLADDRENEVYIDLLEVEPSLQNGGIGSSLLATAIRVSRENGNSSIRLHVERKNRGAIRLYRRFGFKEDPEMKAKRLPNTIYTLDLTREQIWPYMAKPFAPDMASNNPDKIDNEAVENETKAEQLSREVKNERRRVREIHRRWPAAITTFGSARIPSSDPIHAKAKEFGAAVYKARLAIRTGAGPSLMEAPLQGYIEARKMAGDKKNRYNMTQGVRVELPFEQKTSEYVEDYYTFKHFVNRKQALYDDCLGIAVFPGGFGTLDEMFEVWSRQQPMVLIGKDYWEPIINTIYEKWRHSGWRGKIEVNFIITDSIDEALEYLRSANNKITPNSLETTDKSGNDIKSLLTELYRWPAAVTIIGQSEFTDRREIDIIAETVSRLVSLGVPVRSGTANRYLKMVLEDVVKGNRDKLQAVLAVLPGRGIARTERRIFTDNIEDHQVLLAENSLGYIFLPGKIKTLSRLFDLVSTMQTGKAVRKPIVLVGRDFWQPIKDAIVNGALNYPTAQLIKSEDADLLQIVDTSEEALKILGFGEDLDKPFAPDMAKEDEVDSADRDGDFIIHSDRSFEFEGANIEQGEYELKNIPGGCIYPVIEVSINGRQYKVGNGFYVVITLANGKKIYWSGQHNLSYAFFFKHYGKDAQRIIDSGGVIWRHVDSSGHLDLGHYSGFRMSPKQDIDPDKEMEFGMNHLTGGNYLGYALTTGIVSYLYRISGLAGAREETLLDQCVPGSTGSLAGMALKNVRGGVSDIDIDIAVNGHAEINDFEAIEKFEKMKDNLCDVAEQGDVCFITNSSELSTTYLGVPLYIDPHKAVQFSGEVIEELARRSVKPFAPDMAKGGEDADSPLMEGSFGVNIPANKVKEWEEQGNFQKTRHKHEKDNHYGKERTPLKKVSVRHKASSFFCYELEKFLKVDADVYAPHPFLTAFTADEIGDDLSGQKCLDLGTGTGVFGLIMLQRGASGVVFADLKPQAIDCARNNAALLGYSTEGAPQLEFVCSDLFSGLSGRKFNLIIFTPSPVDGWDISLGDGYRYRYRDYVNSFFNNVGEHLAPSSRIIFRHTVFPSEPRSVTYSRQIESAVIDFAERESYNIEKKGPFRRSVGSNHWNKKGRGNSLFIPEETYIYVITKKDEEKPFAPDMAKETPDEGTFEATVDMLLKEGYKEGRQNVDRLVEHLRLDRVKAGFYYNMLHVRTAADEIGLIISEFMLNKEHMGRGVDLRIFSRLAEKSGSGLGIDIVALDNGRGIGNIEDAVDMHGYSTALDPRGRGKGLKLIRRIALEGGGSLEVSSRGRIYAWGNGGVGADEKESVLREGTMIRVVKIFPGIKPLDKPFAPDMAKEGPKTITPKQARRGELIRRVMGEIEAQGKRPTATRIKEKIAVLAANSPDVEALTFDQVINSLEANGIKLQERSIDDAKRIEQIKRIAADFLRLHNRKPLLQEVVDLMNAESRYKDVTYDNLYKWFEENNISLESLGVGKVERSVTSSLKEIVDAAKKAAAKKGSNSILQPDIRAEMNNIKPAAFSNRLRRLRESGIDVIAELGKLGIKVAYSEPSGRPKNTLRKSSAVSKPTAAQSQPLIADIDAKPQPQIQPSDIAKPKEPDIEPLPKIEFLKAYDKYRRQAGGERFMEILKLAVESEDWLFVYTMVRKMESGGVKLDRKDRFYMEDVKEAAIAALQTDKPFAPDMAKRNIEEPDAPHGVPMFEKSFEIKLPADRETADDFRSRALNFIYGLRYARDTKIVPTEQVRKRMHKIEGLFRELKEKTGDNPLAYAKEDLVNVWLELLNNAHDGLVSRFLAGELTGNGIVDFKGWIKDGMLVATIEDHGTGVVFQPNGSLVITPKTHEQGFLGRKGIGAKLAEAIVVLKGGEITWKNLENGGTRVIVKIPADMLKTSQAILGIYEDPLPRSPNDTKTALKPVQFLRDIVDTKELTQNMIEGILSALFSNKKLTLAFSKKLKGLESAELRIVVRRLKEWKEATAQNNKRMKALLDNLTILEYDDLRQALAANNIDANARDGLIFTYAPKPADESENTANIGSAVRPVYIIEQDGEFPVHYYYPLLEMVTISLAKEILQWDGSQLKEALLVSKIAVDTLGLETAVDEKFGILIFKVLPKIERYNNNSRVDRYTKLLQFLRSA